jgi:phospholipid/cholesterol/gamma-HCH transport system ATP-binding protein
MTGDNNQGHGNGRSEAILEARNMTKRFGEKLVLDNISLSIEKGKTTVVIGPSGCGKTVLIKHFIVLIRPSEGEVLFKGRRVDNLSEHELEEVRTHFGYLFQEGALFDSMTVAENIMFPIQQHHKMRNSQEIEEIVKTKLAMVGLDGFQNYYPARLRVSREEWPWPGGCPQPEVICTMSRRRDSIRSARTSSMS